MAHPVGHEWTAKNGRRMRQTAGGARFVASGSKLEVDVNVNASPKRSHNVSHSQTARGMNPLRTEAVTRIKIEDAADFIAGFLDGLASRKPTALTVREAAESLWTAAHPQGPTRREQVRDVAQYDLGHQLAAGELVGLIAVHLGWTPAEWTAVCPPELAMAAGQDAAGALTDAAKSGWFADDFADDAAGAVAGGLLADIGELSGAALGSFAGPGGTALGGAIGNVLGTFAGQKVGVKASNTLQDQMGFFSTDELSIAAGIP